MSYSEQYDRYRRFIGPVGSQTPQWEPLPRKIQRRNAEGAYSFPVDDWKRLERFLILGSEANTFYVREPQLTAENAQSVIACIREDGLRALSRMIDISASGRAPKNSSAIFCLALAFSYGDTATRRAAEEALKSVCRTGTHLFLFAQYISSMRGWGKTLRRAVGNWYAKSSATHLALQVIKYKQRNGWSHRDLLRLAHPIATSDAHAILYHWIVKGWPDVGELPHPLNAVNLVWAYERAKHASRNELFHLISTYRLPQEAIPKQYLSDPVVWGALLSHTGLTAVVRNLGNLTRIDVLGNEEPQRSTVLDVCKRLRDEEALERARLHPMSILTALTTYAQGHGVRGAGEWRPDQRILEALNAAFYSSFRHVQPTMKRIVLAVDVSGSMGVGEISGLPGMTPNVAAAAMAMQIARTEPQYDIVGFRHEMQRLDITPRMHLERVLERTRWFRFGATDCALPILWALEHEVRADAFVILTDSESWYGPVHPADALRVYRQQMNLPTKLITISMVPNGVSIADPDDNGMLDIAGFDVTVPDVLADFIRTW